MLTNLHPQAFGASLRCATAKSGTPLESGCRKHLTFTDRRGPAVAAKGEEAKGVDAQEEDMAAGPGSQAAAEAAAEGSAAAHLAVGLRDSLLDA